MKINQGGAEEGSPVAPPPHSLANLLEEGCPRPCITRKKTTKPYNFGSTDSWSWHSSAGSFTSQLLLSWCIHWSNKSSAFIMVWRNVTRLLTKKQKQQSNVILPQKSCTPPVCIRVKVAWGDLPPELLGEIGKRLTSRVDILRFRSACAQWRSSLPPPIRFPLRVPPPPNYDPELHNVTFIITEVGAYWTIKELGLLVFEEVDQGSKFRARLIPGAKVKFPTMSFMTSEAHPYSNVDLAGKAYHLRMAVPRQKMVQGRWDFVHNPYVKKMVVISSNASDGVNPSYARASDLCVVAHLAWGTMRGRLALLRLGGSPENWVWDTDFCTQAFLAIATYKGQLCVVDHLGRVFLMDHNSLQMIQLSPPWPVACDMNGYHLFEAHGDLYLADLAKVWAVVQYKLCLRLQKWLEVDKVGGPFSALIPFLRKIAEVRKNRPAPQCAFVFSP